MVSRARGLDSRAGVWVGGECGPAGGRGGGGGGAPGGGAPAPRLSHPDLTLGLGLKKASWLNTSASSCWCESCFRAFMIRTCGVCGGVCGGVCEWVSE